LAGNWPEIAPNTPFLPDVPVRKLLKTNVRLPSEQHGMEEVVGSIPTRSTIFSEVLICNLPWHGSGLRFLIPFHNDFARLSLQMPCQCVEVVGSALQLSILSTA
jgi:hypothetical protein